MPPNTRRLIEPFVGSGAVALNLGLALNLLGDANADLIAVFNILHNDPRKFIAACAREFTPENNGSVAYYRLRSEFNTTRDLDRKACLFVDRVRFFEPVLESVWIVF